MWLNGKTPRLPLILWPQPLIPHADNGNTLPQSLHRVAGRHPGEPAGGAWCAQIFLQTAGEQRQAHFRVTVALGVDEVPRSGEYRPDYPRRLFQTVKEACGRVAEFVEWYNHQLRHSGWESNTVRSAPIAIGPGWVRSLIELKNGELSGPDGTLRSWTPVPIVRSACHQIDLASIPTETALVVVVEAAQATCRKIGVLNKEEVRDSLERPAWQQLNKIGNSILRMASILCSCCIGRLMMGARKDAVS
jgi:hypothetical protein